MWVLKLKLNAKDQFLGRLAVKHKVSVTGYPLSFYRDSKGSYIIAAGFIVGEEHDKKAFIKDLESKPELIKMEVNGDFAIITIKQPESTSLAYDPRIIRHLPTIVNKEGYHIWHLASFERELLSKVIVMAEKHLSAEILSFKQEKLSNISITKALSELTIKQKRALEIAINAGYYNYPKKVKMETLAKKMNISYSTFQAHLKKAEGKIIPEVYKEL